MGYVRIIRLSTVICQYLMSGLQKFADSEIGDDRDSVASDAMATSSVPPFQNLLMQFLDNRAPVLGKAS